MTASSDDLVLTLNGQAISGWTDVRVTRGIEQCPSDFSIGMTERYPGQLAELIVKPGDACTVSLGTDLVITGYVDRFIPSYSANDHSVRILGRSKCCDLVDCSVVYEGGQINMATILTIGKKLAEPYGVSVNTMVADLPIITQLNVMLGESPYECLERLARFSGVLLYDMPDGSLVINRVSATKAASGFVEGENVQQASIEFSMDQRYSNYVAYTQSLDVLHDLGAGGNLLSNVLDPNCSRFRELVLIAEGGGAGNNIARQRATWEAARRAGRSKIVRIKTDSWRDKSGVLWAPNTLAYVGLPRLKLVTDYMTIGEVTYSRNADDGTTAELVLMESASYQPEPILLMPVAGDLVPEPMPGA